MEYRTSAISTVCGAGHDHLSSNALKAGRAACSVTSAAELRSAFAIQRRELRVRQKDIRGGNVLLQMSDFRGARDRQHDRAAFEDPGQRHLPWTGAVADGDAIEQRSRLCEIARRQGIPRDESDSMLRAIIQHVLAGAV